MSWNSERRVGSGCNASSRWSERDEHDDQDQFSIGGSSSSRNPENSHRKRTRGGPGDYDVDSEHGKKRRMRHKDFQEESDSNSARGNRTSFSRYPELNRGRREIFSESDSGDEGGEYRTPSPPPPPSSSIAPNRSHRNPVTKIRPRECSLSPLPSQLSRNDVGGSSSISSGGVRWVHPVGPVLGDTRRQQEEEQEEGDEENASLSDVPQDGEDEIINRIFSKPIPITKIVVHYDPLDKEIEEEFGARSKISDCIFCANIITSHTYRKYFDKLEGVWSMFNAIEHRDPIYFIKSICSYVNSEIRIPYNGDVQKRITQNPKMKRRILLDTPLMPEVTGRSIADHIFDHNVYSPLVFATTAHRMSRLRRAIQSTCSATVLMPDGSHVNTVDHKNIAVFLRVQKDILDLHRKSHTEGLFAGADGTLGDCTNRSLHGITPSSSSAVSVFAAGVKNLRLDKHQQAEEGEQGSPSTVGTPTSSENASISQGSSMNAIYSCIP